MAKKSNRPKPPPGQRLICRPYVTRNGKRIYPKNGAKAICFYVRDSGHK